MTKIRAVAFAIVAWVGLSGMASAQDWPKQTISLVVAFAPGGSTDIMARLIATKLKGELGQAVIVVNRAGAGGSIGAASVARAEPDGYTLLLVTASATLYQVLSKNPPFNLLKDFSPVGQIAFQSMVLVVHKDFPSKTMSEYVKHVRESKSPMNYGSAGTGSTPHLAGALLNYMLGEKMVHVPYKGGSEAAVALLSRQVDSVMSAFGEVVPHVKSGELRALGVTTSTRSPALPDVPTIASVLADWPDVATWHGVMAPARTPPEIIAKLNVALRAVLKDPEVQTLIANLGGTVVASTQDEFRQMVSSDIERVGKMAKLAGLSPQ